MGTAFLGYVTIALNDIIKLFKNYLKILDKFNYNPFENIKTITKNSSLLGFAACDNRLINFFNIDSLFLFLSWCGVFIILGIIILLIKNPFDAFTRAWNIRYRRYLVRPNNPQHVVDLTWTKLGHVHNQLSNKIVFFDRRDNTAHILKQLYPIVTRVRYKVRHVIFTHNNQVCHGIVFTGAYYMTRDFWVREIDFSLKGVWVKRPIPMPNVDIVSCGIPVLLNATNIGTPQYIVVYKSTIDELNSMLLNI